VLAWGKKYKQSWCFGKKGTLKIAVAWNKKILEAVMVISVQSIHSFLVSVILNRTFDFARICF
jgi:hypothetical protein